MQGIRRQSRFCDFLQPFAEKRKRKPGPMLNAEKGPNSHRGTSPTVREGSLV